MKKLNTRELEVVHRAAEMIETDQAEFSCNALLFAAGGDNRLKSRYEQFYDFWYSDNLDHIGSDKNHRILMLLLFAECKGVL